MVKSSKSTSKKSYQSCSNYISASGKPMTAWNAKGGGCCLDNLTFEITVQTPFDDIYCFNDLTTALTFIGWDFDRD